MADRVGRGKLPLLSMYTVFSWSVVRLLIRYWLSQISTQFLYCSCNADENNAV